MTSFDEITLRTQLTDLARIAACDLAWLAANHLVLKSVQQSLQTTAAATLTLPEHHIFVPNGLFAPEKARQVWENAVSAFHLLRKRAASPPQDDPGHFLNKAAVVYAVAVVEGFLDEAYKASYKAAFGKEPESGPSSVRSAVEVIAGITLKNCKRPKRYKTAEYPANGQTWAKHALFLAEVRNIIVHGQGRVDEKFLVKVGYSQVAGCSGSVQALWEDPPWSSRAEFYRDNHPLNPADPNDRGQVCLDVSRVVIPYIERCATFVEDVPEKFVAAARRWSTPGEDVVRPT